MCIANEDTSARNAIEISQSLKGPKASVFKSIYIYLD